MAKYVLANVGEQMQCCLEPASTPIFLQISCEIWFNR